MCVWWCFLLLLCVFCFKQKTAYEMRISDWSSDVCSSDLADTAPAEAIVGRVGGEEFAVLLPAAHLSDGRLYAEAVRNAFAAIELPNLGIDYRVSASFGVAQWMPPESLSDLLHRADTALYRAKAGGRSEEHTSELQSLMRISYAVFCLKKKKKKRKP